MWQKNIYTFLFFSPHLCFHIVKAGTQDHLYLYPHIRVKYFYIHGPPRCFHLHESTSQCARCCSWLTWRDSSGGTLVTALFVNQRSCDKSWGGGRTCRLKNVEGDADIQRFPLNVSDDATKRINSALRRNRPHKVAGFQRALEFKSIPGGEVFWSLQKCQVALFNILKWCSIYGTFHMTVNKPNGCVCWTRHCAVKTEKRTSKPRLNLFSFFWMGLWWNQHSGFWAIYSIFQTSSLNDTVKKHSCLSLIYILVYCIGYYILSSYRWCYLGKSL